MMIGKRSFLLLLLLIFSGSLFSQQIISVERRYRQGSQEKEQMSFWLYPYTSSRLDLRDFKGKYPDLKFLMPDFKTITPPDLSGSTDIVYAVTFIKGQKKAPGVAVIILIKDFNSTSPIHYIDLNLDGDYSNDPGSPYVFPDEVESKRFTFQQGGTDLVSYSLELINPNQLQDAPASEIGSTTDTNKPSAARESEEQMELAFARVKDKFRLGIGVTVGFGSTTYSYEAVDTGYPTNYQVGFNAKGLSMDLAYRMGPWIVNGYISYEDLFYWTSYRETKLGEPFFIRETTPWGSTFVRYYSNIKKDYAEDSQPDARFTFGLRFQRSFKLGKRSHLLPFVGMGAYIFNGPYFPEAKREPDERYDFPTQWLAEAGFGLRSRISPRGAINFAVAYRQMQFDPEGFFTRPEIKNPESNSFQIGINLGYEFVLF